MEVLGCKHNLLMSCDERLKLMGFFIHDFDIVAIGRHNVERRLDILGFGILQVNDLVIEPNDGLLWLKGFTAYSG